MSFFDSEVLDLSCPNCGAEHPKTIGWIKAHNVIACSCGATINLDKSQLLEALAGVEKQLDDLPTEITIKL